MTGLVFDLTNALAKSVGFKPRYVLTRTWGRMLPNGTLFGTRGNVSTHYCIISQASKSKLFQNVKMCNAGYERTF